MPGRIIDLMLYLLFLETSESQKELFEGDIVLTANVAAVINDDLTKKSANKYDQKSMIRDVTKLWITRTIPYVIDRTVGKP